MQSDVPLIYCLNYDIFIAYLPFWVYEVHSTIIFPGSRVSYFAGNSRTQKLNKAQKNQANITGAQNNSPVPTESGVNFVSSFLFYFIFVLIPTFCPYPWRLTAVAIVAVRR